MGGAISDLFSSDVQWASPIARSFTPFLLPQTDTKASGEWGQSDQALVAKLVAQQGHQGAIIDVASLHSHPAMTITYAGATDGETHTVSVAARSNPYEENDTIFDDLLDTTSGSALQTLVTELGAMGSSSVPIGSLSSLDNAMTTGMGHKPEVFTTSGSNTVIDAFAQAAIWLSNNAALFTTAASTVIVTTDTAAIAPTVVGQTTDLTITPVTDKVAAAIVAQNAIAVADEALVAARLADTFQSIRGASLGNGHDISQAQLAAEGVRTRAFTAAKMYADFVAVQAQQAKDQVEINFKVKQSAHEAAKINLAKQETKGRFLLSEMTAQIDAAMKACSEHVSGYIQAKTATAQMSVQLGIALAEEYVRAFGFQFNWLAGKAGILEQLVKLRNLKVEHAVRAKLWNVDLIPYWQAAFGAAGAATVKKPSAFDNVSNGVGLISNTAATLLNAYGALK